MKQQDWKKWPRIVFALAAIAAVVLVGGFIVSGLRLFHRSDAEEAKPTNTAAVRVRVATAELRTLKPAVHVIGAVQSEPDKISVLTAKTAGSIEELLLREGESVAKNDVIIKLDDRPNRVALQLAEAAYARLIAKPLPEEMSQARDDVQKTKAAAALAESRLKKAEELRARSAELVPEIDILDEKRANEVAKADLDAAQSKLQLLEKGPRPEVRRESQLQIEAAKLQLEYCQVRAVIAGKVVQISTNIGHWADVGTPLATIVDTSEVLVQARIPSDQLNGVLSAMKSEDQGELAVVRCPSFPDTEFRARGGWISEETEAQTSDVSIKLRVPNSDDLLRPGMTVEVELHQVPVQGIAIPEAAVTVNEEGHRMVTVIRDNKAVPTEIASASEKEPEVRAGGWIRVLSGLRAGDVVAVENGYSLPKDTPVDVLPSSASEIATGVAPPSTSLQ